MNRRKLLQLGLGAGALGGAVLTNGGVDALCYPRESVAGRLHLKRDGFGGEAPSKA